MPKNGGGYYVTQNKSYVSVYQRKQNYTALWPWMNKWFLKYDSKSKIGKKGRNKTIEELYMNKYFNLYFREYNHK